MDGIAWRCENEPEFRDLQKYKTETSRAISAMSKSKPSMENGVTKGGKSRTFHLEC